MWWDANFVYINVYINAYIIITEEYPAFWDQRAKTYVPPKNSRFCKNYDDVPRFRTHPGEIDPGESEFEVDSIKDQRKNVCTP